MISDLKRPKIIINCAISADGKIALPNRNQIRISSEEDIKRVHNLRNTCDAVLVGIGAVLSDNPKLTVKGKYFSFAEHNAAFHNGVLTAELYRTAESDLKSVEEAIVNG